MKNARKYGLGMTLIELMVALGIGMFLLIGAISVFIGGRTSFKITESVARLQESGRFALDVLESDIRMAHYFGLQTRSYNVSNRYRQPPPAALLPLGPATCGNHWINDVDFSTEASNNVNPAWLIACAPPAPPTGNAYLAGTDTIIVRRASEDTVLPAAMVNTTWYVRSGRFPLATIFPGSTPPSTTDFPTTTSETHRLIVDGYYISSTSSASTTGNLVPSLRARMLQGNGTITDNEILPGVQDMQIQLGLDTDLPAYVLFPAAPAPGRGAIDRYVNGNDPIIDPTNAAYNQYAEVLSVRVWLLLRAETIENGVGSQTFNYAGINVTFNDNFRRLLVSKTIFVRNAQPSS